MELEMFTYKRYASVVKYTGNSKHVVIPQQYNGVPVTEIRADAFAHNTTLEAVLIPSTLQAIGANAFANCYNLRYIGSRLEGDEYSDIPARPEAERPDLEQLTDENIPLLSVLPESVQMIDAGAFAETGIQSVDFKGDTIEIGDSAFEGCQHLELVALFSCERLMLGKRVFMNSAISRFYAPKARLNTMPDYAFAGCKQLRSALVYISAAGVRAFYGCEKLKLLRMPKELRSIGREAFAGCDKLEGIRPQRKKPAPKPPAALKPPVPSKPPLTPSEGIPSLTLADRSDLFEESNDDTAAFDFDKEADLLQPDVYEEDIPGDLKQPLFRMAVKNHSKTPKTLPAKVKGSWSRKGGTFQFSVQAPSPYCTISMHLLIGQSLIDLSPLLGYLEQNCVSVILSGKQDGDIYSVYDITPLLAGRAIGLSHDLFRLILKRAKRPVPADVNLEAMVAPFTMRSESEYDTLIELCGNKLPAWVLQAYHKNLETSRRGSGRLNDDEAKHARRALELLMNIDWLPCVVDIPPAEEVRRILDEEFFGLEVVKDRIMEVVAQIRRTKRLPKWGILIHGPAGTAKTSIAKAVARIFGMPLIQMDISSIGKEAETVSGSSRIYNNARPGMLLETMFQFRSSTAVLLANEVDKAGENKGGRSVADILLTILDKTGFYENFLEEIIPTDNLFCIGTCNDLRKISKPLKDRFLVIDIAGYSADEKKVIFDNYVLPAARAKSNILPEQLEVDAEAVDLLVSEYALEPGARDLEKYAERFVGNYCRLSDNGKNNEAKRVYTTEDIKTLFGPGQTIRRQFAINPGQINAAFYHDGKAYFFLVEAAIVPGSGKFKVLGPMSKIQEEYCEVAYWCARNTISNSVCDFTKRDVAIFIPQQIPEGADNHVGLACYCAICSKLMNTNLAINEICFIGGCDMNGSLYFDENDLTPLLRSMKSRGISTLFAPMGTNRLVNTNANADSNVMIVEAADAKTLFSLAVAQSRSKHGAAG